MLSMTDARLHAPATARNRDPILDALRPVLPASGRVLEIASGSGEHVVHFAAALPEATFVPSDPNAEARASIAAWVAETGVGNVVAPMALDAACPPWPIDHADAIVCINMIHISPWAATEGLFAGASAILSAGAPLCLYGPYRRDGRHTAPSNETFDAWLRGQNPEWGVRDLERVAELASDAGFGQPEIVEMPANNLVVIFRRRGDGANTAAAVTDTP
jgi:cyclopropane fatty-acyl-phospholipid synthase-like methyltransferase